MNLFLASETWPFGLALVLLVMFAVLEGASVLFAVSASSWLDGLVDNVGLDTDGVFEQTLGWLHVGKLPILVLLTLFLFGFAFAGYATQMASEGVAGHFMPVWLALLPAFAGAVTSVRIFAPPLSRIVPKDETAAVSEDSLIGRAGVVVMGVARAGMAAQIKVKDTLGHSHYVMVEPDVAGEEFGEGEVVLIVKRNGAIYRGIRNPHPDLL